MPPAGFASLDAEDGVQGSSAYGPAGRAATSGAGRRAPLDILGGDAGLAFAPRLTLDLAKQAGIEVLPVRIRPVVYNLVQNYGVIEVTATARAPGRGRRTITRRVVARHYIMLDAGGRLFRVNPIAIQVVTDRSGDAA